MLSGINKKLLKYIIVAVGVVIGIFVLIFIIRLFKGKRLSISALESELKKAAQSYYTNHEEELPKAEGETKIITDTNLVEAKKIKSLSKIEPKGYSCSGSVTIQKNGNYYLYTPHLDCGEKYKTINLSEKIKEDNPVVTAEDGLYVFGDSLLFRGEKVNNFVSYAGQLWRILRINADNTIRIVQVKVEYTGVWDDRYNIKKQSSDGINDFTVSRLQDGLDKIYNELDDMFDARAKEKMVLKPLCIGKRNEEETDNSGNVECSVVTETPKAIGLMLTNEFMLASLDKNCIHTYDAQCANYNYMENMTKSTWTLIADSETTNKAYKFYGSGYSLSTCSNESGLRLVINLSGNLNYSKGTGTEEDPYIVA